MSALTRLRTAPHEKAAIAAYCECVTEYHENKARRMREEWLVHEISQCVKRLNVLRAMQVFEVENAWHPAVFRREIARNNRMLKEHRNELEKLRSEQ